MMPLLHTIIALQFLQLHVGAYFILICLSIYRLFACLFIASMLSGDVLLAIMLFILFVYDIYLIFIYFRSLQAGSQRA